MISLLSTRLPRTEEGKGATLARRDAPARAQGCAGAVFPFSVLGRRVAPCLFHQQAKGAVIITHSPRQEERKSSALTGLTLHLNRALMRFNDSASDVEPKAKPLHVASFTGTHKAVEN